MIEALILFIIATLVTSHVGIAYASVLTRPGNLLDWLPGKIDKIKNPYLKDLLMCCKCISGQFALWTFVAVSIYSGSFHWFFSPVACIMWICWIVVFTDQANRLEGYA